jgi:hypothetical protein
MSSPSQSDPIVGRYQNPGGADLIEIVSPGSGVQWRLSETSATWFEGTGNPGTIWQFNGKTWVQIEIGGSANPTPNWINVRAYGALGNGRWDTVASASGTTVTLQNKSFSQGDIGKAILITAGATTEAQVALGRAGADLWTTITAVNGSSCTIAMAVTNSLGLAGTDVFWGGTDDTTAIQAAINAASESQSVVYFPTGVYIYSKKLTNAGSNLTAIVGDGPNSSILLAQNPAVTAPTGCLYITSSYSFQIRDLWVRGPGFYNTVSYAAEVEIEPTLGAAVLTGASGISGAADFIVSDCYALGLYFYNILAASAGPPISLQRCKGARTYNGGFSVYWDGSLSVTDCVDDGQMYFRAIATYPSGGAGLGIRDCTAGGGIIAPGRPFDELRCIRQSGSAPDNNRI